MKKTTIYQDARHRHASMHQSRFAFTLLELLVVIAVIGVLTALLLPAISSAKAKAQSTHCQTNLRQLQMAYSSYSNEEHSKLVSNSVSWAESGSGAWVTGNVQRYTSDYEAQITEGALFQHIRSKSVYKCPSSSAFLSGGNQTPIPHNRSYSVSVWLASNAKKASFSREQHVLNPSSVFAFIDENAVSIDNGAFGVHERSKADTFWNLPSNRHLQGCNLSFLDGHVEHWRWKGPFLAKHNRRFNANDTRTQRPDPNINPTQASRSDRKDPDLIRLSSAVPKA